MPLCEQTGFDLLWHTTRLGTEKWRKNVRVSGVNVRQIHILMKMERWDYHLGRAYMWRQESFDTIKNACLPPAWKFTSRQKNSFTFMRFFLSFNSRPPQNKHKSSNVMATKDYQFSSVVRKLNCRCGKSEIFFIPLHSREEREWVHRQSLFIDLMIPLFYLTRFIFILSERTFFFFSCHFPTSDHRFESLFPVLYLSLSVFYCLINNFPNSFFFW